MTRSGHHSSRGRGRGRDGEDPTPSGNRGSQEREESPPPELNEEEEAAGSTQAEVPPRRQRPNVGPDGRIQITILNKRYIRNFNLQLIIKILFVKFNLIFFLVIQFAGFIHPRMLLRG